ncbi:hypothetical protein [Winslowiella toletana]|uniref:hypothetical protein n=1 Tax=Winslowiella toletana TaxID=92490 RepID=UPI0028BEF669|nr:hypothetical protein [Winslowiella toletana]WNN46690.1 hypothetical protein RIN69_22430 [Winslowiella toletana]
MLTIRLSDEIESCLDSLAKQTNRQNKAFYVREAILTDLEDLDDCCLPAARLRVFIIVMKQCIRFRAGGSVN